MSLFDRFRRSQKPSEGRTLTTSAAIPKNSEQWGSMAAGEHVSPIGALQHLAVNACVRILADTISGLPLDAFSKRNGLRTPLDPPPALIESPFGPEINPFEGWDAVVRTLALRGEALLVISRWDRLERAVSLMPCHPDDWTMRREVPTDRTSPPVYMVAGHQLARDEVVHIKRFSLPGELHGLSPIAAASMGIGLGLAAERYGATWFRDSANPSAVLEAPDDMTDDQVALSQTSWISSHGGRRHPAVLSGGLKYRNISINPNESQFLETRQFQRGEIAMLYGIPPHMIGDTDKSTSWGTGIEQQSIGFVRYTLQPWLTCIESSISALLPPGQFAKFNVDALMRADTKSRYDAYVAARTAGWQSVNEIRALEDLSPVPGGDTYIQPLNMGPLGSDPLAAKEGTVNAKQDDSQG